MAIRPAQFAVITYSNNGNGLQWTEPKIHTRVCSRSGAKTLGIIVDIGKRDKHDRQEVKVRWFSGKNKGKELTHCVHDLADYDAYKAALIQLVAELDANEQKVGCLKV